MKSSSIPLSSSDERFSRLEDSAGEFHFYYGEPSTISVGQWLFVLAMVVVGFLSLAMPIHWLAGTYGGISSRASGTVQESPKFSKGQESNDLLRAKQEGALTDSEYESVRQTIMKRTN
jgi:hypothetical protein